MHSEYAGHGPAPWPPSKDPSMTELAGQPPTARGAPLNVIRTEGPPGHADSYNPPTRAVRHHGVKASDLNAPQLPSLPASELYRLQLPGHPAPLNSGSLTLSHAAIQRLLDELRLPPTVPTVKAMEPSDGHQCNNYDFLLLRCSAPATHLLATRLSCECGHKVYPMCEPHTRELLTLPVTCGYCHAPATWMEPVKI